jgi:hypothetical protein
MESAPQQPTEFQRFEALVRRILTTPKAELMKQAAPNAKTESQASTRKRKGK